MSRVTHAARALFSRGGVFCLLVGLPVHTNAQQPDRPRREPAERTSASLQAYCSANRARAQVNDADTAAIESVRRLSSCGETAGATLPNVWQTLASQPWPRVLDAAIGASMAVRDARIEAAVRAIAVDPSAPTAVRKGAIVVLANYADPHISGRVVPSTIKGEEWTVIAGASIHAVQEEGSSPVDPASRARTIELLTSLASARPRTSLTYFAETIVGRLK